IEEPAVRRQRARGRVVVDLQPGERDARASLGANPAIACRDRRGVGACQHMARLDPLDGDVLACGGERGWPATRPLDVQDLRHEGGRGRWIAGPDPEPGLPGRARLVGYGAWRVRGEKTDGEHAGDRGPETHPHNNAGHRTPSRIIRLM